MQFLRYRKGYLLFAKATSPKLNFQDPQTKVTWDIARQLIWNHTNLQASQTLGAEEQKDGKVWNLMNLQAFQTLCGADVSTKGF